MTPTELGPRETVVRYVLFAVLATIANLATQELAINISPVAPLTVSILAGTIVGFALKYVLDKLYVFSDSYDGRADEARKIFLYGAFSVVTTLIFWAFEMAAWHIWGTSTAKYAGAVLGLAIGYAAKYFLDKHYTFRRRAA